MLQTTLQKISDTLYLALAPSIFGIFLGHTSFQTNAMKLNNINSPCLHLKSQMYCHGNIVVYQREVTGYQFEGSTMSGV